MKITTEMVSLTDVEKKKIKRKKDYSNTQIQESKSIIPQDLRYKFIVRLNIDLILKTRKRIIFYNSTNLERYGNHFVTNFDYDTMYSI